MSTWNSASNRAWWSDSSSCDTQCCNSDICQRTRKFEDILGCLTVASNAPDYMNEITTVVKSFYSIPVSIFLTSEHDIVMLTVLNYQQLMASLSLELLFEFDGMKHKIDHLAQQYLTKASKQVQHLVPIETLGDGNCLYNSILRLLPKCCVSAVELRGLSDHHVSFSNICAKMYFFPKFEQWSNS